MEAQLMALASATSYPQTPDLAAGFWSRLRETREARQLAPAWSLAGAALAAAVVIVAALVGTVAPARDAAADLIDRVNIFRVDEDAFEGITRDIRGEDVTLAEAEQRLGRPIALPEHPEGIRDAITRVVFQELPNSGRFGNEVSIAHVFFEPEGGAPFVLFATNQGVGKGLAPGAESERLPGFGAEAYWLEGLRLVIVYSDAGNVVEGSYRATEANTLLWVQDGRVYRIEGEIERDEAIAIAQSVR